MKRNAHLREAPTTRSQSLEVASVGDQFELLDDGRRQNGFYKIDLGDGRSAWIYNTLVTRLAGVALTADAQAAAAGMTVHFIDVDQGAATLLEFPCAVIMIDAGGRDDASTQTLMDYLEDFFARRADLNGRIETIFITHTHVDHNLALPQVAAKYEVGGYVHNGVTNGSGSSAAKWMLRHRNATGAALPMRPVPDADVVATGTRGLTDRTIDAVNCASANPSIRVLSGKIDENPGWPAEAFGDGNNKGIVIRVDLGEASFLFTGDLEEYAIETMVEYYAGTSALDVDVWNGGHHGSANGITTSLLTAMSPEIAVLSMGPADVQDDWTAWAHGHPRRVSVDMIHTAVSGARDVPVSKPVADKVKTFTPFRIERALYGTGWDGTITIAAKPNGTMTVSRQH